MNSPVYDIGNSIETEYGEKVKIVPIYRGINDANSIVYLCEGDYLISELHLLEGENDD